VTVTVASIFHAKRAYPKTAFLKALDAADNETFFI
jgi:hypothetical protein